MDGAHWGGLETVSGGAVGKRGKERKGKGRERGMSMCRLCVGCLSHHRTDIHPRQRHSPGVCVSVLRVCVALTVYLLQMVNVATVQLIPAGVGKNMCICCDFCIQGTLAELEFDVSIYKSIYIQVNI